MIIKDIFQIAGAMPMGTPGMAAPPEPKSNMMLYVGLCLCCVCCIYCSIFAYAYNSGMIFAKVDGGEASVGVGDCPEGQKQECRCVDKNSNSGNNNNNSNNANNSPTNETFENETDDDDE